MLSSRSLPHQRAPQVKPFLSYVFGWPAITFFVASAIFTVYFISWQLDQVGNQVLIDCFAFFLSAARALWAHLTLLAGLNECAEINWNMWAISLPKRAQSRQYNQTPRVATKWRGWRRGRTNGGVDIVSSAGARFYVFLVHACCSVCTRLSNSLLLSTKAW